MPDSPLDVHVLLDVHPAHTSAVTATLTGPQHRVAQALLSTHGFEPLDQQTMVLARIDHEEPHWAEQAATALSAEDITTEITPRLRDVITEKWTWVDYHTPWLTRGEIRDVSNEPQQIYDAIRLSRLIIHAHAHDGPTTVAVGTYRDTGKSVYLHGQNHLRQIADTFDSPTQALAAFQRTHGDAVRPGPAPMTETERETNHTRNSLAPPEPAPAPAAPQLEHVPAYPAAPGDHDALLNGFFDDNGDWEKYHCIPIESAC